MTLRHGRSCEVVAISETQFTGKKLGDENCVCHANLHRHVKPRTLEDVLRDAMQYGHDDATVGDRAAAVVAKYADEIRGMLGAES